MDEFHYRIPWRSSSAHPGHHRSQAPGGGHEFHGHTSLVKAGDPHHLNIRASLSDPFGEFKVRQFLQTSIVPVFVLADLSASMQLGDKPCLLARLSASIAYSVRRTGDPFGFIGIGADNRPCIYHPLRRHKSLGLELERQLKNFNFGGQGLDGRTDLDPYLGHRRALVFLLSDFHFPLDTFESVLEPLQLHDVVPVVLWLRQEWEPPARWGVARLRDPESGSKRLLWLRPALKDRLALAFQQRRDQLTEVFRKHGRPPFFVVNEFQPDALSHYFLETCA